MAKEKEKGPKIAFLFFPHQASEKEVDEHIRPLNAQFPNSVRMISVSEERSDLFDLINKPGFFHEREIYSGNKCLMARAFPLFTKAIFAEADIVFLNTAMLRYSPQVFISFVKSALSCSTGNLYVGVPPVLHPDRRPEITAMLADEGVRKSLMVDIFTSFALCSSNTQVFQGFMNLNAGIFGLRTHYSFERSGVLRAVLGMKPYWDTDLLAPMVAWHICNDLRAGAGLSIRSIPVDTINLDPMKNDLAKRIQELDFLLTLLERKAQIGNRFELAERAFDSPALRVVFRPEYKIWFETEILGKKAEEPRVRPNIIKSECILKRK